MIDRLFRFLSFVAFTVLIFLSGIITFHYEIPPAPYIAEALSGAEAWVEQYQERLKNPPDVIENVALPDKPPFKVFWNKEKALSGYTLLTSYLSATAKLVDMQGKKVHGWDTNFARIWPEPTHIHRYVKAQVGVRKAHVFPNGDLLVQYTARGDTPYGYGLAKLDKNSNVIWRYAENAHHDFYIDQSNAEIFTLTQAIITKAPDKAKGLALPFLDDYIVRLTPEGKEIEKLSVLEAFLNSDYALMLYYKRDPVFEERKWDLLHTNSIMKLEPEIAEKFPMFKAGQVLLSLREPGIIAVVDLAEKKVIWAMKGYWKMQHDAKFLSDGTILMHDNLGHVNEKIEYSRILKIDTATAKPLWFYVGDKTKKFYNPFSGGVQALENGNILISSSTQQNIFEVNKDREIVWDYQLPPQVENHLLAQRYKPEEVPFLFEKNE